MTHEESFLVEAQSWLNKHLAILRAQFDSKQNHEPECRIMWDSMLCAGGYVGINWPQTLGGRGLSIVEVIKFHELCASLNTPQPINSIGHAILAPTLLKFGREDQLDKYLPGILSGTDIWCQGYSEPASGSDLASVKMTAVKNADNNWVVNGHKIWTTQAHLARWCFALVRTTPKELGTRSHSGLSFMLIDMKAPGVRVEQIKQLTGEADYNEIFFEDVEVSADQLLGHEGDGWKIAMAAAEFERGVYFLPRVILLEQELSALQGELAEYDLSATKRIVWEEYYQELADICQVIRWRVERVVELVSSGQTPGIDGAILKLLWSETRQKIIEARLELCNESALSAPSVAADATKCASMVRDFLWSRAETIVAGTTQIQKNIIGERLLGLPKDR